MADNPTTGDLFKAKLVTNDEVDRAVEVVLSGAATDVHALAGGYTLDLVAAVANHTAASAGLAADGVSAAYRRNLARTAILLARPVKA